MSLGTATSTPMPWPMPPIACPLRAPPGEGSEGSQLGRCGEAALLPMRCWAAAPRCWRVRLGGIGTSCLEVK